MRGGEQQGAQVWAKVPKGGQRKKTQTKKKKKTEKGGKVKKWGKGGERAEAGGSNSAQNITDEDQNSTEEEEDQPRTVERKIYRGQQKRKLRKLNDDGKLEIVPIKTHNSSDFSDIVLRPKDRKRSKNERGRRVPTEDILECEGGRLVP